MGFQTTLAPHASSIWDAEETCDAFAFQKNRGHAQSHAPSFLGISSPESRQKIAITDSKLPVEERPLDAAADGDPSDEVPPDVPAQDSSAKDFIGLTEMLGMFLFQQ